MAFTDHYDFHLASRTKQTSSLTKRKNLNIELPKSVLKHTMIPNVCMKPSKIFPFLWLGSKINAYDHELLMGKKEIPKKVTLVINISKKIENKFEDEGIIYIQIPLHDNIDSPIMNFFEETFHHIERARIRNEIVFVHCHKGISRSATIVIAYIMRFLEKKFLDALKITEEIRPIVEPNIGFIRQLQHYEKTLYGKY